MKMTSFYRFKSELIFLTDLNNIQIFLFGLVIAMQLPEINVGENDNFYNEIHL